ncbi:ABC transporter substrate-binding protein [Paracoccus shanxieyensis]|uniref:ABC transporter substrate-binding protein n=1 Tax=Paracoccus shanxieyensis TaxID=2675752 RepID=A0A6L6J207_9RHOB|nr:ABC transporter substrate-binding protein [Paracoccus shanxieyensis]MTH65432.1 ABC transporter substrate-binding protein [Paracoccus shanxieyensis]MTH88577.1 ABC transporter substrate-binding protein [Paracoccus shanxieyensis]
MLRRQFLASAAALPIVTMLPAGLARAATPRDQFVIATNMTTMRGVDPHEANQIESIEILANLYDRLVFFEPDNLTEPKPQLATAWNVSEDGRSFTFTIREGVRFHSGNPLTAKDVEWSLHRLVKLGLSPAIDLRQWGFNDDNVETLIRATDARTVVIETPELWNQSLILGSLASSGCSIVDRELALSKEQNGDMGRSFMQASDAGSGPFSLRNFRPNDVFMADAFADYWNGAPAMRRVIMRHMPESSVQRLQLQAGDLDVATRLSSTDLAGFETAGEIDIQKVPGFGFYYIALNQKDDILSRPQVREAFRYLIDYDGLSSTVMRYFGVMRQTIIPTGLTGVVDQNPYRLDIEKAKELLAEAGLADGFSKKCYLPAGTPYFEFAQSLQANAAQAGIRLELLVGDYLGKFRERTTDIYLARSGERLPDPHAILQSYASNSDNSDGAPLSGLLAWRAAWDVPQALQEKVFAAARETDPAKRAEIYTALNEEYLHSSPALVTSFERIDVKAVAANVSGYVGHPTWVTRWDTVTKA